MATVRADTTRIPRSDAPCTVDSPSLLYKRDRFGEVANAVTKAAGSRFAFVWAIAFVLVWGVTGPFFHYSENWQLIVNTGTSIATFLMVFLIQNSQNRESKAVHLKLDELILSLKPANNALLNIEGLTEEQLDMLKVRYHLVAEQAQSKLEEILDNVEEEVAELNQELEEVAQAVEEEVAEINEELEEVVQTVEELEKAIRPELQSTVK